MNALKIYPDRRIEKEDDIGEPFKKIRIAGYAASGLTLPQKKRVRGKTCSEGHHNAPFAAVNA